MNRTPLKLVFDATGPESEAARQCEADVFGETYGNTRTEFAAEYGPYEPATHFLAVLDRSGHAVAAARCIRNGPVGLKTLNDLARPPWQLDGDQSARSAGLDPQRTWDVATIAVRRDSGRAGVSAAALYHGLATACRANHINWVVMIMDERARRLLSASGVTTERLPGAAPGPYLGSAVSTPLFGDLRTMFDVARVNQPDAYRLVFQGIGLSGIELPSGRDWVLQPRPERVAALI